MYKRQVLSVLSPDDLRFAVLSDDIKTISRAPGLGKKTAQKVILELKDKFSLEDAFEKKMVHEEAMPGTAVDAKGEAVQALTQDRIDAVVIDGEPAKEFVAEADGLKILDEAFTEEEYAIAVAKDNDDLLKKMNEALASLKESGKIDEIVAKYISADKAE